MKKEPKIMMTTLGRHYSDCVVEGHMPEQDTFTKAEANLLVKVALMWAATQIDHTIESTWVHDDSVERLEYGTIKEAAEDIQEGWASEFGDLQMFLIDWM